MLLIAVHCLPGGMDENKRNCMVRFSSLMDRDEVREFYKKKYILASSVMTYIIPYVVPFTTIHKVLVVIFALSSKNV
jgi:hypothetical protein